MIQFAKNVSIIQITVYNALKIDIMHQNANVFKVEQVIIVNIVKLNIIIILLLDHVKVIFNNLKIFIHYIYI